MRFIVRLLVGLIVIVVIIVGAAYFLPREVSVARSVTVDAPPQAVFPYLTDFRKFNEWSPWSGRDPDMVVEYEGPASGVGAIMKWDSGDPDVGTGRQEITVAEEFSRVESSLDFGDMGAVTAVYSLEPRGDATMVTWGFSTDLGLNPMWRYMGLMMDRWVGADYEAGLARLKEMVEAEVASTSGLTAGPAQPAEGPEAPAE